MKSSKAQKREKSGHYSIERILSTIASIVAILLFAYGIVKGVFYVFPHVHADFMLLSKYGCEVKGVSTDCVLMDSGNSDSGPRIQIDITNNSRHEIIFDDYDGVEIILKKYIPYEELEIVNPYGGANPWEEAQKFTVNNGTELGTYYGIPDKQNGENNITNATLSIDPQKHDRFIVWVSPMEPGYYKFNVRINYSYNGKKKYVQSKKTYEYVCERGTNQLNR